jgi:GTPase
VKQIFEERTPTHKSGKRVKVFYATQIETAPPTIALIVNNPSLVDANYQRFMINRFRELLPYAEVPIKLLIRARKKGEPEELPEPAARKTKQSSKLDESKGRH